MIVEYVDDNVETIQLECGIYKTKLSINLQIVDIETSPVSYKFEYSNRDLKNNMANVEQEIKNNKKLYCKNYRREAAVKLEFPDSCSLWGISIENMIKEFRKINNDDNKFLFLVVEFLDDEYSEITKIHDRYRNNLENDGVEIRKKREIYNIKDTDKFENYHPEYQIISVEEIKRNIKCMDICKILQKQVAKTRDDFISKFKN